jgi:membrane-associated phospholipid phosphatase
MRISAVLLLVALLGSFARGQHVQDDSTSSSPTPYILAGGTALTLLLFAHDQSISDELVAWKMRNAFVKDASPIITHGGDFVLATGVFAGLGVIGYLADDESAMELGKAGLVGVASSGLAVQVLKRLFGRERPEDATRSGGAWHGPALSPSFDSFPSGHSTVAFSVATVFTDMNDDSPWVGYVAYPLAAVTALSRITEKKHWASDVIAGALIGTYVTKIALTVVRSSSALSISPSMVTRSARISVAIPL